MCKSSKTWKIQYFINLNSKSTKDTNKFWMAVKLHFSKKCKTANTVVLHENHRITKDKKISHTFNKYLTNLTKTLKLTKTSAALNSNPLKYIHKQFKSQSIKKIQKHSDSKEIFAFRELQQNKIIKTLKNYLKTKHALCRTF